MRSHNSVEPSMSVNTIVMFPVGADSDIVKRFLLHG
jgi:hypothetical protein